MSDPIESAISNSIASLPGSDASTAASAGSTSDTASVDTASSDTSTEPASADAAPASVSTDGAIPAAPGATPPVTDAVASAAATPAEETLETLKAELAGKRDNRIPYSRVTKIVENAEKKVEARVRAEIDAEVAEFRTPEFKQGVTAMKVADENPEQFLVALSKVDPRYAELLAGSKVLGGASGKRPAAEPPAVEAQDVEPDIQLTDGTLGFSADAQRKREVLMRQQMKAEFDAMLAEVRKEVDPIVKDRRIADLRSSAETRVAAQIKKAESLPGFQEHRGEIAARFAESTKRGESLTLQDAYIEIVVPKLNRSEADVRAKVIEEMRKAPAAAGRVGATAAPKPTVEVQSDVDPIEAAIRASIRR